MWRCTLSTLGANMIFGNVSFKNVRISYFLFPRTIVREWEGELRGGLRLELRRVKFVDYRMLLNSAILCRLRRSWRVTSPCSNGVIFTMSFDRGTANGVSWFKDQNAAKGTSISVRVDASTCILRARGPGRIIRILCDVGGKSLSIFAGRSFMWNSLSCAFFLNRNFRLYIYRIAKRVTWNAT